MVNLRNIEDEDLIEVVFSVPDLKSSAIVGGGCCAVPADFLIEQTLNELEQVREIVVSEDEGVVRVWLTETEEWLMEELVGQIEDLGFRVLDSRFVTQS